MSNLNKTVIDKIVQHCFTLYNKLPKTGKPIDKEWTVLSCIVKHDVNTGETEVVSLGTGSKCIGSSKMSANGSIMNDSHAEVFARRGFLLYLYNNIDSAISNKTSIFTNENGHFKLKDNIEFIFYSSQLPCGDASIIPKTGEEEHFGDILPPKKHHADDEICDVECKKQMVTSDVHRTGAKCLPNSVQDSKEPGAKYHILGQVRTKPGRGDRTLSVSCSDKIAKWIHIGIHGSLLDMLCEPIYIKHFIFGAGVPYSEESLCRALLKRNNENTSLYVNEIKFYQSSLKFGNIKTESTVRAAPCSIVWVKADNLLLEVAVQGKKLGVTKKKANMPSSSLCISKYNLYKRFQQIVMKNIELKQKVCGEENVSSIPYNQMKMKSTRYLDKWLLVKQHFFKTWTIKPDMWDFCVNL